MPSAGRFSVPPVWEAGDPQICINFSLWEMPLGLYIHNATRRSGSGLTRAQNASFRSRMCFWGSEQCFHKFCESPKSEILDS